MKITKAHIDTIRVWRAIRTSQCIDIYYFLKIDRDPEYWKYREQLTEMQAQGLKIDPIFQKHIDWIGEPRTNLKGGGLHEKNEHQTDT